MARAGRALVVLVALAGGVSVARAADAPAPWDGVNPFNCVLQQAGFDGKGPQPEADPYCIEFDKRRQNVTQLGLVEFLGKEPERTAAASPKCFYFQSDHWRGSVVQEDASTKTYEWDGHYFFDKARGEGGVWVSNFNFNGQTGDPRSLPGFPEEWKPFFGPGTGGFRSRNSIEPDPRCAERAKREQGRIYAGAGGPASRCMAPGGRVGRRRLGPARLGDSEAELRRALGPPRRVSRGFLRWCVSGGGRFLAGQRSDRSGDLGEGASERAVLLLSTSRALRVNGVGPGSKEPSLRRLPRAAVLTVEGATRVFVARPGSPVIVGVRQGIVRYVGVRDRRAIRTKRALRRYLRRAR
jgi:hypothetical protein